PAPVQLTCGQSKQVECGSNWDFDAPSTECCITITGVITSTNLDPADPCTMYITRTWTATDCCSNTAACTQTVTVSDTTPPQITCAPAKTVECGTAWTFDPPSASDDCCGTNVTIMLINIRTNAHGIGLDGPCHQVITATWQATDCCSNSIACNQTVTVV